MDGIDVARIVTDGRRVFERTGFRSFPYEPQFRTRLAGALHAPDRVDLARLERELTLRHADAVSRFLAELPARDRRVDLVGFHGHTLHHAPATGVTRQLGDGPLLARTLGLPVVFDFRSLDVRRGGQGAPLAPVYHAACLERVARPAAVLNIGGIANITWIGAGGELHAFDCGPGNMLLDEWALRHTGQPLDRDGALARAGRVDAKRLQAALDHPRLREPPPRSLDRLDFDLSPVEGLSPADGAATLVALTAACVQRAFAWLPAPPRQLFVTGGGRLNPALMQALRERLCAVVFPIEVLGLDGDALEAECMAYLAVRVRRRLPTSFPTTTGVPRPSCGGRFARP